MTYIIAEIGQNHNGSVNTAHALIESVAVPIRDELDGSHLAGVDAIKLTKRDLQFELTHSAAAAPYDNPHSYGETYGAHRYELELTYDEHHACYDHAKSLGLDFVLTICAPTCVPHILERFEPDAIKVASRDLTNGPLLQVLAETGLPLILSTGMAGPDELNAALKLIEQHNGNLHSILHCLSQYPAEYRRLNLRTIPWLAERYDCHIGFSDHSIGIAMAPVAVALGAQVIEKHVTLSRAGKGSDHAGSLEPDGLRRMVRDIRNTERALGHDLMFYDDAVTETALKLERSIAAARTIEAGETIDETNTCMLSPGTGYLWSVRGGVYGQVAVRTIPSKELITARDIIPDA